jgi:acyl-CoA thioesterase FadM
MDEAMGWAMRASGAWAMTARMEIKYRKPLPLGEEVIVTAEVVRDRGKRLEAVSEIRTKSGERITQSTGVFLRVPDELARQYDLELIPDEQPAPS